ncbi:Charged multivesicular body protein 5 [Cricetulus griseus]|uniref:Charged multivesicular body protein 5 n=1 Tax=Cricetulus griseus TaxID=10029 RepID=G3IAJ3_CRIGR|nr:Charged multivesicular body protein 5 [Cricetulus griseus]
MNRFFGKAKPKAPSPSLTDCIGTVGIWLCIPRLNSDRPIPNSSYSTLFLISVLSIPSLSSLFSRSFLTPQTRDTLTSSLSHPYST